MKEGDKMNEQDYMRGSGNAYRSMMLHCMRKLGVKTKTETLEREVTQLGAEREEAISVLRDICAVCGDNNWEENLHLADIIDKHLRRYLDIQRKIK